MLRALVRTCLLLVAVSIRAGGVEIVHGTIHRDSLWSPALGVQKQMLVYLPASYDTGPAATKRYPVAVYLHGRWGDETDLVFKGHLGDAMDSLVARGMGEMIVVMPDGDDGWWTTWATAADTSACRQQVHRRETPAEFCVATPRYDEYIVHDVLSYVDSTYRTIARPESRGIGGLSMGGYGAFSIVARHPGVFAAAVSHGGILTPGLMPDSAALRTGGQITWHVGRTTAELQKATSFRWSSMYPMFGVAPESWQQHDPARLFADLDMHGGPMPALYADVAMGDEALQQNRVFREALQSRGINIRYAEWSGKHTWIYWKSHIPDGLRFISDHLMR
jgi:putative tributyrin esterase